MARVRRAHHVLGVPHLLRQLRHGRRAVQLAAAAGQRRKADHEEVQPRERDQVHRQLAQVRVQLPCAPPCAPLSARVAVARTGSGPLPARAGLLWLAYMLSNLASNLRQGSAACCKSSGNSAPHPNKLGLGRLGQSVKTWRRLQSLETCLQGQGGTHLGSAGSR